MFKIFVAPISFFSQIIVGLLILLSFYGINGLGRLGTEEVIAVILSLIAYGFNVYFIKNSILLKNNTYNLLFLAAFMSIESEYLLELPIALAFLSISILNYIFHTHKIYDQSTAFIGYAVLVFIAIVFFFPTLPFFIIVVVVAIYSANSQKSLATFIFTFFMLWLTTLELLYLFDVLDWNQDYFCAIQLGLPSISAKWVYLIPIAIFIVLAIIDHFAHTFAQSLRKRNYYKLYILLFALQLLGLMCIKNNTEAQVLFMYFPVGIFIGRYLSFVKNPYIQNILMILSLAAVLLMKLFTSSFY